MVPSTARSPLFCAALACCLAAAATARAAPPLAADQPINLDAASSEVDYKTNTVVFKDVVISQGATRVQAEHARATGLDFANSKWTFEGKVRIEAEQRGNLRSDSAVVEFRDNHIARATVTGKPAEFEQQRVGSDEMARGHADEIVYDVGEGTVRLTSDAWLSNGQSSVSGPLLVYNIRAQRVQAEGSSDAQGRVRFTISPHDVSGAKTPPPPPATDKPAPRS